MKTDLIDRIYECSFVPELWPSVLDELGSLVDARGGVLFAVRDRILNWTSSTNLNDDFRSYVQGGWFARCARRVCLFNQNLPTFLVEHDFWTKEQIDENPIYCDFFRPRGLGWSAGTGLAMPTGDHIVFSVERAYDRGPIEKHHVLTLNMLRPHLARAALIAARLNLQRAKGANDTLVAMGLPALILDKDGIVIEANALMGDLPNLVQWRVQNHIALTDPRANELLRASLLALDAPSEHAVHSFPLRSKDNRPVMVAHIVPVRNSAHDLFTRAHALLIVTPLTARQAPPVELLRALFDLTVSESRVARGLATGESLDEIAASGSVSRNTVRSQLRQVLEKTGCTRQAEVTALLSNIVPGQVDGAL